MVCLWSRSVVATCSNHRKPPNCGVVVSHSPCREEEREGGPLLQQHCSVPERGGREAQGCAARRRGGGATP
eukprot:104839-Rhodomonas_salina.1